MMDHVVCLCALMDLPHNRCVGAHCREMLIKAIHACGVKFPDIAHSVVLVLMDFLGSDGGPSVIAFVR